jgi:DNA-binding LacI/PurR family transcriptional regulator
MNIRKNNQNNKFGSKFLKSHYSVVLFLFHSKDAKAVVIWLDILEYGLEPPRRIIMPTELVVRASCGAGA